MRPSPARVLYEVIAEYETLLTRLPEDAQLNTRKEIERKINGLKEVHQALQVFGEQAIAHGRLLDQLGI